MMRDEKVTTVIQTLNIGQMVEAVRIQGTHSPDTVSGVQMVRTVPTTLTTGNVSVRYVPRQVRISGATDTDS